MGTTKKAPQKIQIELQMIQQLHFWVYIWRKSNY